MARGAMAFVRGTIRQGTVSDAKNEGERTLVSALGQLLSGAKYGVFALWSGKSDGPDAPVSILSCIFGSVICRKPSPHWGAGRPELT